MSRSIVPPPGSLHYDGVPVTAIVRAPDGRYFVSRADHATMLLDPGDLLHIEVSGSTGLDTESTV